MTKYYKLVDENCCTRGDTKWGPGVTHKAPGDPNQLLCSDGWIHGYEHPLLAVLHNPVHAQIDLHSGQLWECTVEGAVKRDGQMKMGARSMTTVRRIPVPIVTDVQRIAYGILCIREVYYDVQWCEWANKWLSGEDRSAKAARAAWEGAAKAAARVSAAARVAWTARAARAAEVWAAWTAAAVSAAADAWAAWAEEVWAEQTVSAAARAAADADAAAGVTNSSINLIALAEQAVQYE